MYENKSHFERSLLLFCSRVDIICAIEMSNKIDAEAAYQNIKYELKELKKVRKKYNKEVQ